MITSGIDLNRIWDNCSPHGHPTAHAVKTLIEKLSRTENQGKDDKSESPLDFVLDIHVSNTLLGFFVVGNAYDSVFRSVFNYFRMLRCFCRSCRSDKRARLSQL